MNQTYRNLGDYRAKAQEFHAKAAAAKERLLKLALESAAREYEKLAEETEKK